MNKKFIKRLKHIKVLALDVDGVLTDGKIVLDSKGSEIKQFDVQDGFGLVLLKKAGLKTAIISARSSSALSARAQDLNIDKVYQDAFPKVHAYDNLLKELGLRDENVCFLGDDLPDLGIFRRAGCAVAVANACQELKKEAHYVTKKFGGYGAVREVVEMILKAQGLWGTILKGYY